MSEQCRVVVAGNLSLDDTVNPTGRVPMAPGGDALYASLGVAAWGRTPTLLTLVGDDYPDDYRRRIAASGIDVSRIRGVPGPTVHYEVRNFEDGRREYRWISPEGRLAATSPEAADYAVLANACWLHIAAMPIECQEVGAAAARRAAVPYSLDPHEEYVRGYEPRIRAIVKDAVFMPSELEIRLLFPDLDAAPPFEAATVAADRLADWGPAMLVIKLGSLGSVVRLRGQTVHVPAPPVPVVDSTGAGDAYAGGFVAGWLATRDVRVAAACGTVAAGEIIGRFGAFADGDGGTVGSRIARVAEILGALPRDLRADLSVDEVAHRLARGGREFEETA